ncbi:MAG: peptidoglycan recognition protein family protein [Thermoleophilia bacterium]
MPYDITLKFIRFNRSGEPLVPQGFEIHSTATPGATDENEQAYFDSGDREASANFVLDWDSITMMVPENEVSWAAGYTANHRYEQAELCEPADGDPDGLRKFQEVWNRAVWLTASRCIAHGWGSDRVVSHNQTSQMFGETDHTDPVGFFARYGRTWQQFLDAVAAAIGNPQSLNQGADMATIGRFQPIMYPQADGSILCRLWYDDLGGGRVPVLDSWVNLLLGTRPVRVDIHINGQEPWNRVVTPDAPETHLHFDEHFPNRDRIGNMLVQVFPTDGQPLILGKDIVIEYDWVA